MPETIETLDQRLRERAWASLRVDLRKALDPIRKSTEWHDEWLDVTKLKSWRGAELSTGFENDHRYTRTSDLLDFIEEALFSACKSKREDDELKNFLKQVDNLQEQLNELKGAVNSGE